MKTEKEIRDRIEDIDNAVEDLANRGNTEELSKLLIKIRNLEWVLK